MSVPAISSGPSPDPIPAEYGQIQCGDELMILADLLSLLNKEAPHRVLHFTGGPIQVFDCGHELEGAVVLIDDYWYYKPVAGVIQ